MADDSADLLAAPYRQSAFGCREPCRRGGHRAAPQAGLRLDPAYAEDATDPAHATHPVHPADATHPVHPADAIDPAHAENPLDASHTIDGAHAVHSGHAVNSRHSVDCEHPDDSEHTVHAEHTADAIDSEHAVNAALGIGSGDDSADVANEPDAAKGVADASDDRRANIGEGSGGANRRCAWFDPAAAAG